MTSLLGLGLAVLILVLLNGFFAGAEIAIISANKPLLKKRAGEGSLTARLLEQFRVKPRRMLGTYVIGSTLCAVAASTLVAFYLRRQFGEIGELYALLIMTPLLLVFGEMAPKLGCQEYANALAGKSLLGLWFFSLLFYPLVWLLGLLGEIASRIMGGKKGEAEPFFSKSELEYLLIEHGGREELKPHEQRMIRRIFRFSETTAGEVMIPLVEVKAVADSLTVKEALELANRFTYSHYPVFQERIDNIIGTIKTTDLLAAVDQGQKITGLIKPVFFAPETMPIDVLLEKMQRENFLTAVVVDEYSGSVGIVTREDILEEVIGEIRDEHEQAKPLFRQLGPSRWMLSGRMEITQINEILGWNLPKQDFETLAGFLLDKLQRIPKIGEILRFEEFTFLIKRANPRAILEVMAYKEEPEKQGKK